VGVEIEAKKNTYDTYEVITTMNTPHAGHGYEPTQNEKA